MKAAIFRGKGHIEIGHLPDPHIEEPTDAIVRIVLPCVCGSYLWYYRGESPHPGKAIGHEFMSVVEDVGAHVQAINEGDLVISPFNYSDGTCESARFQLFRRDHEVLADPERCDGDGPPCGRERRSRAR